MPILLYLISTLAFADVPKSVIRTTDLSSICFAHTDMFRNVSEKTKKQAYARDGIEANHKGVCDGERGCEVDHRVSLELGGSNDISNLIVKPYFGKCNMAQKDVLENKLHKLVCTNQLDIKVAQEYLYGNWQEAYAKYVKKSGCWF